MFAYPVEPTVLRLTASAPELTTSVGIVFGIIAIALIFFVFELLPIDVTAIGLMVLVIVLEPRTQIPPQEGISGFAAEATITVSPTTHHYPCSRRWTPCHAEPGQLRDRAGRAVADRL